MLSLMIWSVFLISSICYQPVSLVAGNDITSRLKRQALADSINSQQSLWKAEYNEENENRMRNLMHKKYVSEEFNDKIRETPLANVDMEIPKEFDARQKWPQCKSIGEIHDQSNCGGGWAMAAADVMTDRLCIATNGKFRKQLSAADILSCCHDFYSDGCDGGNSLGAFEYWIREGVVDGGDYESKAGCKPYPFPPCSSINGTRYAQYSNGNSSRYVPCSKLKSYSAPRCQRKCSGFTEKTDKYYSDRLIYGAPESSYRVKGEQAIQKELMTNGPITLSFRTYEDFAFYSGGIYKHIDGDWLGGIAVRVIGWGEAPDSNGTMIPYWLIANSWNEEWGENGYFRIIRGINHCNIEGAGATANADVSRLLFENGQTNTFLLSAPMIITSLLIIMSTVFN